MKQGQSNDRGVHTSGREKVDWLNGHGHQLQPLLLQLLKNYPDGSISIIDRDFNVIYTDGELYAMIKTDPADLIGKSILRMFPKQLHSKICSELEEAFCGNTVSDFELPDCCGKKNSYALEAFPLIDCDKRVKKAAVIITNIAKIKKAEGDLVKALEKERELGELKSRFVSMASHEFRTPLSTILSSTYLLSKYITTEEQPKREKHLERIVSSVNSLTDILNDFLSLGQIEEGKISVRRTDIDIPALMTSTINEIRPLLKSNQAIDYQHRGGEKVELDKGLLKHIILNLLSNAIKFSNENSTIEVATMRNGEFTLSVKDQGIGICTEDQKHIFERFFRGTNAADIQGTGLGLHIVDRYARLMNGKVQFTSRPGIGTEFTVTFKCGRQHLN